MRRWKTTSTGRGRELLRRDVPGTAWTCAQFGSARAETVVDADGVAHGTRSSPVTTDASTTMFGELGVARLAYRHRRRPNLHPADAELNLPEESHSHGLRRLAAIEVGPRLFEATRSRRSTADTGVGLGKRQVEQLASRGSRRRRRLLRPAHAPDARPGEDRNTKRCW